MVTLSFWGHSIFDLFVDANHKSYVNIEMLRSSLKFIRVVCITPRVRA